jgi:hypothetical protein
MTKKKLKKPTDKELYELWVQACENEGFGYYMLDYGPDLDLIEKIGFDREEIEAAIHLFRKLQEKIMSFEELGENVEYD